METKLNFSTAYHPQTNGQSERIVQTLEDMIRLCVLDFKGSWIRCLPSVEFAFKQLLAWNHMKLCMGASVDHHCIGMKLVKGNY
jgi:hypothetical protein